LSQPRGSHGLDQASQLAYFGFKRSREARMLRDSARRKGGLVRRSECEACGENSRSLTPFLSRARPSVRAAQSSSQRALVQRSTHAERRSDDLRSLRRGQRRRSTRAVDRPRDVHEVPRVLPESPVSEMGTGFLRRGRGPGDRFAGVELAVLSGAFRDEARICLCPPWRLQGGIATGRLGRRACA